MSDQIFEAMIYDVDLETMTARFRVPEGLPFRSGMYDLRFNRTPTEEDINRWEHLPEPRDDCRCFDDGREDQ